MHCGRGRYCDFIPSQPIDLTLPKATPESVTGEATRKQHCAKCQNHGIFTQVKGHKRRGCPKKDCDCELCLLTDEKRIVMRQTIAARRLQTEEKECGNYIPPEKETSDNPNNYEKDYKFFSTDDVNQQITQNSKKIHTSNSRILSYINNYGKLLDGYSSKESVNEKAVAYMLSDLQWYFSQFSIDIAQLIHYYPTGHNQFDELLKRVYIDRRLAGKAECKQNSSYTPVMNERTKHHITNRHSHHNHYTHTQHHRHTRSPSVDAMPHTSHMQHTAHRFTVSGGSHDIHYRLWRSWDNATNTAIS